MSANGVGRTVLITVGVVNGMKDECVFGNVYDEWKHCQEVLETITFQNDAFEMKRRLSNVPVPGSSQDSMTAR